MNAMRKKTFMATIVKVLLLSLVGMQFVEVAEANFPPYPAPTYPITDKPIIHSTSPANNSTTQQPTQEPNPTPTTTISPSSTNSLWHTEQPKKIWKTWVDEAMAVVRVEAVLAILILVLGLLTTYFLKHSSNTSSEE